MMRLLCVLVALLLLSSARVGANEFVRSHPFHGSASGVLDMQGDWYVRLSLPSGKRFCFFDEKDEPMFSLDGFFVPLLPVGCEDYTPLNKPARVQFNFHHNVLDDEWEFGRENCKKNVHDNPDDAFLAEITFADLGRINGLRAQRCVRVYLPNKDNPKPYYMNGVTLFHGKPDDFSGVQYEIVARGDLEYRAQLDAFLAQVLNGVHPTPLPKATGH